jgi:general secretion pathway protein C
LARTVNTLVGAAIRPKPQGDAVAVAAAPARPALPLALDPDRLYRLIGVEPPKVEEAGPAAAAGPARTKNCGDAAARPIKSDLRLQVVAGIIGEVARNSLATILDPTSRETRVLGVGEEFAGAQLLSVERLAAEGDVTGNGFRVVAVICNAGTKEYLDGDPGSQGPEGGLNVGVAQLPPPRPGGAPAPGSGADGVRKLDANRYEIDKQVIEGALTNLNNLATQARLVPSFKNGVANGFKLFQIQPGSLYSSIGIENGDVITRINGYEVNSPDKALEVYQKLRESAHVTIELERGGQPIKKDYNIKGP